jgi:hypothetical protein
MNSLHDAWNTVLEDRIEYSYIVYQYAKPHTPASPVSCISLAFPCVCEMLGALAIWRPQYFELWCILSGHIVMQDDMNIETSHWRC